MACSHPAISSRRSGNPIWGPYSSISRVLRKRPCRHQMGDRENWRPVIATYRISARRTPPHLAAHSNWAGHRHRTHHNAGSASVAQMREPLASRHSYRRYNRLLMTLAAICGRRANVVHPHICQCHRFVATHVANNNGAGRRLKPGITAPSR